ncbi:hybrid sensor histidine kinase/response regulator [Malikia spinosa]|uniref:hybrid sensor histidine kinase/response regulator n=1 Tax=Malikia spinosa TaxID=86180 RepID=UPI003FA30638
MSWPRLLACVCRCWLVLVFGIGHASAFELGVQPARVDLAGAVEYLEDPTRQLQLQDLARPEVAARFQPWRVAHGTPSFGYTASAYWLRLCLSRPPAAPADWLLELSYPLLSDLEFHAPGQPVIQTGAMLPLDSRPIPDRYFVFPISLEPKPACFHLRAVSQEALVLPLLAWQPAAYQHSQQRELLLHGLYHGGLLALLLYNLLLFLSLRDRRFLLYSLYAATFSLGIFAGNGFGRVFLWPDSPRFDIQAQALFLSLAAVFSVGFACDFLQTRLQFPRLHGWLSASALGFAAVLLALLAQLALDFEISGLLQLNMFNAILMGVLVSVASALVWRRRVRSAGIFLLAWGSLWLGAVVATLQLLVWIPANFWTSYSLQIGAGIEMLLLSLALADTIRRERERAFAFQAQALESRRQAHELDLQLATSRQLARDKSEFLARVSHELRTPLSAIIGYARMLRRGSDRITLHEGSADIERSGMRLLRMIEELLDQSRLSAGGMRLAPAALLLRPWLDEIGRAGRLMADSAGNQFELLLPDQLPHRIEADGLRLRQVLDNLLGNANRHTHGGCIVLSCVVCPTELDDCIRLDFAVSDSGEGIVPSELDRIFEPFFMGQGGQPTPSLRAKRMGLGLSISRDLVRLMGGELRVRSQPGQGSTFYFSVACALLPEAEAPDRPSLAVVAERLPTSLSRRRGELRLLIAEDDPAARLSLVDLLEAQGFTVQAASSGHALVALLADGTQRWDAVVTDQLMPDGDGWTVLNHVRTHWPSVPVVVLSAMALLRPPGCPAGLDFDACLAKPVDPSQLFETLERLLPPLRRSHSVGSASAGLEPAEREALAALVRVGAVTEIEEWADELRQRRPELDGFAQCLLQAARRLELHELKRLATA